MVSTKVALWRYGIRPIGRGTVDVDEGAAALEDHRRVEGFVAIRECPTPAEGGPPRCNVRVEKPAPAPEGNPTVDTSCRRRHDLWEHVHDPET